MYMLTTQDACAKEMRSMKMRMHAINRMGRAVS